MCTCMRQDILNNFPEIQVSKGGIISAVGRVVSIDSAKSFMKKEITVRKPLEKFYQKTCRAVEG